MRSCRSISAKREDGAGWGRYGVRDALGMELALSLARLGLTQLSAATFVRTEFPTLVEVAQLPWATGELSFGFAEIGSWEEGDAGLVSTVILFPAIGRAADVHAQAQTFAERQKCHVFSTVLINVAQRLELLKARARLRPTADRLQAEIAAIWEEQPGDA